MMTTRARNKRKAYIVDSASEHEISDSDDMFIDQNQPEVEQQSLTETPPKKMRTLDFDSPTKTTLQPTGVYTFNDEGVMIFNDRTSLSIQ